MKKIIKPVFFSVFLLSIFISLPGEASAATFNINTPVNAGVVTGSGYVSGSGFTPQGVYRVYSPFKTYVSEIPTVYVNDIPQETASFTLGTNYIDFVLGFFAPNTSLAVQVKTNTGNTSNLVFVSAGTQDPTLFGCTNGAVNDPYIFNTSDTLIGKCPPGSNSPITRGTDVIFIGNAFKLGTVPSDISIKVQTFDFTIKSVYYYSVNNQWEIVATVPYGYEGPSSNVIIKINGITFAPLISFNGPILAKPSAPNNFVATPTSTSTIQLNWEAPFSSGDRPIKNYKLERKLLSDSVFTVLSSTIASTTYSYVDSGLSSSTAYQYKISAISDAGTGLSTTTNVTTLAPVLLKPTEPTNFIASEISTSTLKLNWNAPLNSGDRPITSYKLERKTSGDATFTLLSSAIGSTVYSYLDSGLLDNTSYQYRISAISDAGEGLSTTTSATTFIANTSPTISLIEPNGVGDSADKTYKITWTDSDPDSSATISLYYDTDNSGFDGVLITSGILEDSSINYFTWNTTNVAKGNYYVYATINDSINPAVSVYSSGTVSISHLPKAPSGVSAGAVSPTGVFLSWTAPTNTGGDTITGYEILRKLSSASTFTSIVPNTNSTVTSYVDSVLSTSTAYSYAVRTITSSGKSTNSSTATVTTTALPLDWNIFIDDFNTDWFATTTNSVISDVLVGEGVSSTTGIKLSVPLASGVSQIKKVVGSQQTFSKTHLTFSLKSSINVGGTYIKVNTTGSTGSNLTAVKLNSYGPTTLVANTWYTYNIPLSALNSTDKLITSIKFTFSKVGTYYIDDIKLQ